MVTMSEKKLKPIVYSIEECKSCNVKTKRPFQMGDYIYKDDVGECKECHGKTMISMIYSETPKPT